MADYIPFVNTKNDCKILKRYFSDANIVRVPMESLNSFRNQIPANIGLWIDPGIDGYEYHLNNRGQLPDYLKRYCNYDILADVKNFEKPNKQKIKKFVYGVLGDCFKLSPKWITVPQLPVFDGNQRNKINSELAKATYAWKTNQKYKGKLVFPVIFTHQGQLHGRTHWKPRIDSIVKWFDVAKADCLWVVDSNLSDQQGTTTLQNRFSELIAMHSYLRDSIRNKKIIAGPYWGINLILWARNLCDNPSISMGTAYRYYLSGAPFRRKGKSRIAIDSLKRWVVVNPELRIWLADAIRYLDSALHKLSSQDTTYKNLSKVKQELEDELDNLSIKHYYLDEDSPRNQVSEFYKNWLRTLENIPSAGRTLALYQDFSSAYVLGKHLPTFPSAGNSARRPERVAEYFMLNCL